MHSPRFRLLPFLLALLVPYTLCAKETPKEILEALPKNLGGLSRENEVKSFTPAALGCSLVYRAANTVITLYVYDLDVPQIAEGIEDAAVKQAFAMAKSDLQRAVERKMYADLEPLDDGVVAHGSVGRTLRATFHLTRSNDGDALNVPVFSEIDVFGGRGHIIKLRMTGLRDHEAEAKEHVENFLRALLPTLKAKTPSKRKR